jgi:talin
MQLLLVYCQSRDDIVSGKNPVSREEAIQFAALQAQIQNGDFKSISLNLKEYLPPQYQKKEFEPAIFTEWRKLVGMTEVNTRFRYVQMCRSLKTYGMTCFKVKERVPGKKKLMEAILGFTRDTIIRMEYESKTVIKQYPLRHLLRWASSPETFTMDFGAHEEDYVVVITNEGEQINNLVAGYIDLLLKRQKDTGIVIDDDDSDVGAVAPAPKAGGAANASLSNVKGAGTDSSSYTSGASDCSSAAKAIDKMINDLFGEVAKINDNGLTPQQKRDQVEAQAKALQQLTEALENLAKSGD